MYFFADAVHFLSFSRLIRKKTASPTARCYYYKGPEEMLSLCLKPINREGLRTLFFAFQTLGLPSKHCTYILGAILFVSFAETAHNI